MSEYVGVLERGDPLFGYMQDSVMPGLNMDVREPVFHVSRLQGSNTVYKYSEQRSRVSLIGKFYAFDQPFKAKRLKAEFDNLSMARGLGLTTAPNRVVRPVGQNESCGLGLLEEYVDGNDLDHYIIKAVHEGWKWGLKDRLTDLAFFLAELHRRTDSVKKLDFSKSTDYYDKVIRKLAQKRLLDDSADRQLRRFMKTWAERDCMYGDSEVIIHGDATPTNFIFPKERGVIAIDLERMRVGDRMFDVGMVCGELKHAFQWRTGDRFAAEDYIAHFLYEYSRHFDKKRFYRSVVRRNPYFMALTELRIARNSWIDAGHRAWLVKEALRCLKWGLKV